MIITCPTCLRKYEVDQKSIGDGRMVRCIICGTTWQQELNNMGRRERSKFKFSWRWFFSIIFFVATYVFVYEYTPVLNNFDKYKRLILMTLAPGVKNIEIRNIAHQFVRRDDGIYVSLVGDIVIDEHYAKNNAKLMFNLKPYFPQKYEIDYKDRYALFNETWEEKIEINSTDKCMAKFKTDLKKIPEHDILCTIEINI